MIDDLSLLHLSRNEEEFNLGIDLFIKKWEEVDADFVEYFNSTYVFKTNKWYEWRSDPGISKTNNGLERLNRLIKSHYTLKKRLPLNDFLTTMEKMVNDFSSEDKEIGYCYDFPTEVQVEDIKFKKL